MGLAGSVLGVLPPARAELLAAFDQPHRLSFHPRQSLPRHSAVPTWPASMDSPSLPTWPASMDSPSQISENVESLVAGCCRRQGLSWATASDTARLAVGSVGMRYWQPRSGVGLFGRVVPVGCSAELGPLAVWPSWARWLFGRVGPVGCSAELAPLAVRPSWARWLFGRVGPVGCSAELGPLLQRWLRIKTECRCKGTVEAYAERALPKHTQAHTQTDEERD